MGNDASALRELTALLEVSDAETRERARALLQGLGVHIAESRDSVTPQVTVRDNAHPESKWGAPNVIRLWKDVRRPRTGNSDNPFSDSAALGWIDGDTGIGSTAFEDALGYLAALAFPSLAKVMSPSALLHEFSETRSSAKPELLDRLQGFCDEHGILRHVTQSLITGLDELYTNAVYNAPVDSDGGHLFEHVSRSEEVVSPRPVIVRFAIDDDHVAISVKDNFGSLDAEIVRGHLRRCYGDAGPSAADKAGGAGLGYFMLLQEASRLIVNVGLGSFAEIVLVRRRHERRRDFLKTSPSLNLCVMGLEESLRIARKYPRSRVSIEAVCDVSPQRFKTTILDLSRTGAFIALPDGLPDPRQGARVSVVMRPKDGTPVVLEGVVRWCGRSNEHYTRGFGVEFDEANSSRLMTVLTPRQ